MVKKVQGAERKLKTYFFHGYGDLGIFSKTISNWARRSTASPPPQPSSSKSKRVTFSKKFEQSLLFENV